MEPLVNVLTACVCEYSYICHDGVAEWCDKAQASITQYDSEAVQRHTILHATDIRSLQVQGGTTYAHIQGLMYSMQQNDKTWDKFVFL